MMSESNTHLYNRGIDSLIEAHPIQEELLFAVNCNDCGHKGEAKFHPYGMKCGGCGGYNTSR
jgi:hypothetical protein